jgi:hypothetical protein
MVMRKLFYMCTRRSLVASYLVLSGGQTRVGRENLLLYVGGTE